MHNDSSRPYKPVMPRSEVYKAILLVASAVTAAFLAGKFLA